MTDLFSRGRWERIALPDADITLLRDMAMPLPDDRLLQMLIDTIAWRQQAIRIYGRSVPQPRLIAWYGDPGSRYRYSGITLFPLPWTDLLRDLKHRVETCSGCGFNSVLLNLYRDHHDSIGEHSDDEAELGPEPVIASLTFGVTRTLVLKHKHRRDARGRRLTCRVPLATGSLLLMRGKTQQCWTHAMAKQRAPCGPRVNLTFRTIVA